jgi:hypothetical protein
MTGTKTIPSTGGSPAEHNRYRASEKALDRVMEGFMRVETPSGWRRKKHIMKVEGARLRELVVAVARDLQAKRRDTSA